MSPEEKDLIKTSWRAVEPIADDAAALFYDRLFELDPQLRLLFRHTDMTAQRTKLLTALGAVGVRTDEPPPASASRAAWLVADTGNARWLPPWTSFCSETSASRSWSSVITRARSSTTVSCSPPGVKTTLSDAPDAAACRATSSACWWRSNAATPDVDAYGLIASTSAPSLARRFGMMNDTAPYP